MTPKRQLLLDVYVSEMAPSWKPDFSIIQLADLYIKLGSANNQELLLPLLD